MNLGDAFKSSAQEKQRIDTLVCDVFGTLILKDNTLNGPLIAFLRQYDEDGVNIIIASSDPKRAQQALAALAIDSFLLKQGVIDKMTISQKLFDEKRPYMAIDDDGMLVWFDAAQVLLPTDPIITKASIPPEPRVA
jgi:hypothetical protein